jgi:hypothetical protein
MTDKSHLELALLSAKAMDDSTSNNKDYLLGLARRAEVEALVSIAESLDALRVVLQKWDKHSVPVITERVL